MRGPVGRDTRVCCAAGGLAVQITSFVRTAGVLCTKGPWRRKVPWRREAIAFRAPTGGMGTRSPPPTEGPAGSAQTRRGAALRKRLLACDRGGQASRSTALAEYCSLAERRTQTTAERSPPHESPHDGVGPVSQPLLYFCTRPAYREAMPNVRGVQLNPVYPTFSMRCRKSDPSGKAATELGRYS